MIIKKLSNIENNKKTSSIIKRKKLARQNGSAIIIALLVMVLLMGFVALAVSRTTNETIASSNDTAETMTFEAAQASLEIMTHNFDKIFDYKLNPDSSDLARIKTQYPPGFESEYNFSQKIEKTKDTEIVVMTGQLFQGLSAIRDEWQIDSTATNKYDNVEVALRRKFFNNRIPIFQFGIFYEDDLEFHPGPRFDFGGRVHSNRHIFMKANSLYFSSKVSASGEIFTDVMRNGDQINYSDKIRIKNATGNYVSLNSNMGSVLNQISNGVAVISQPDMPIAYANSNWESNEASFQGNLLAKQKQLDLPLKIASEIEGKPVDYIEIIKRGKKVGDLHYDSTVGLTPVLPATEDSTVTAQERYYNKTGIRISLADRKEKLPGCASGALTTPVTTVCGIRLDGDSSGQGNVSGSSARGYQPRTMTDGYTSTPINGARFYRGLGIETWIKIETVKFDPTVNQIVSVDITQDILSLGVTEPAPIINESGSTRFAISSYGNTDSRSIVKLQRFIMNGAKIEDTDTNYLSAGRWNAKDYNFIVAKANNVGVDNGITFNFLGDSDSQMKNAIVDGYTNPKIVPFPIKMFDTREGLYNDNINTTTIYGSNLPSAGVLTLVDIDLTNFKKFLDGDFNAYFPSGTPFYAANSRSLKNSDIPEKNGWVVYFSDRRGDADFDGEYDMEDIYGNNDGIKQFGEDVNDNGVLDTNYTNEAVKYTGFGTTVSKGVAATIDHTYYRRGVRLINAERIPGIFDLANPANTKGFTFASENGVYTLGNYNATGITSVGEPTPSSSYQPQNTPSHVPASVVGDAVTILSRAWTDANSFKNAFNKGNRDATETTVRFAMIAGDTRSSLIEPGEPDQGGSDVQLTGGVHNFKRFLENWGTRLNYSGSLINLYNSRNNNAAFKCCNKVYGAPTRNWVFDSSFLDANRLPPGTPYFQTLQLTGFQRVN